MSFKLIKEYNIEFTTGEGDSHNGRYVGRNVEGEHYIIEQDDFYRGAIHHMLETKEFGPLFKFMRFVHEGLDAQVVEIKEEGLTRKVFLALLDLCETEED